MFSFRWGCPIFFGRFVRKSSKQLLTIQKDEDHISEKIKSCFFLSFRYRKRSQTEDVKSQSTERSVRKIAQPKRDSAFEQETRIVPSRETSGSSQNIFLVTTKEKSKAELKQGFLERTRRRSGKFVFSLRWNRSIFFGRFRRKTIAHKTKWWRPRFRKGSKAVFISIRYRKTSQTRVVKSQSTKRSLRELAQPKRDSTFEQETRLVSWREISGRSQNSFWVTTEATSPPELEKPFLERTQRRFGKFLFCSRSESCFFKYSLSQDISNAGFKEPKHQT